MSSHRSRSHEIMIGIVVKTHLVTNATAKDTVRQKYCTRSRERTVSERSRVRALWSVDMRSAMIRFLSKHQRRDADAMTIWRSPLLYCTPSID
ncbi:hypothetical protein MPTK2_3g02690 [Marchantia polymorpha subsp. ruderalis]